ncbi:hypothetical protein AB0G00_10195 [Nocardia salmonicida]|uniref:hypothetical protein n=1 Tax=Nocardia salmonicida TaxID=53431 RepID=UPI0034096F39
MSCRVVDRAATGMRGVRPLTIAIVELDEGPWVYTSIEGGLPPLQNCPVRVQFQSCSWDDGFPVFAVSAGRPISAGPPAVAVSERRNGRTAVY